MTIAHLNKYWCVWVHASAIAHHSLTGLINMKLIILLKIGKKDYHLKKDLAMCDSFEIDCIEETSLHAYLNTFY